jgi:hypothetical protein
VHRLLGLGGSRGDHLGAVIGARAGDRGEQDRQLVETRILQHDVERAGEKRGIGEHGSRDVGRVLRRAERRYQLAHLGQRLGRKGRQRQAATHGGVRKHHAGAARDRQHADGRAGRLPPLREQPGDVDDGLDVVDLDQAALTHRRAVEVVAAGHVGSVRGRGLDARIGGAGFPDQHGLAGLERLAAEIEEAACVRRALEIGEGERRAGVVEEGREQLWRRDVHLVARGDAIAKAHALRLGEVDDGVAEAAGLEGARHAAGLQLGLVGDAAERGPHPGLDGDHALAVGADDAHAGLGQHPFQLLLQLASLRSRLAKAGGEHHREGNAGLAAVANCLDDAGRGDRDHRQLARRGDGHDIRKAGEPMQLRIPGIDGKDAAAVAGVLQRLERVAADAVDVGGSADDGDALWME